MAESNKIGNAFVVVSAGWWRPGCTGRQKIFLSTGMSYL